MTLLILADDLTGAADSAARCHHAGLPATIYLEPPTTALPVGAVALTSDSRYLPPDLAAQRVCDCLRPFQQQPDVVWYKKIDSTLRGNLGAELDAMLTILAAPDSAPCVVICPAFPAQGRGLVDGYLVHNQSPPRTLHLPTLLAQQTTRPVASFALSDVQAGVRHLATLLAEAYHQHKQLLVVDALGEGDLDTVVAAAQQALPNALFCGSAGLIEKLARSQISAKISTPATATLLKRPILALVGSGSAMAHRQLAALRSVPNVGVFVVRPELEPTGQMPTHQAQIGWVYHHPQPGPSEPLEGERARALAAHLAQVALLLIEQLEPQTLLLVGGDTTVHVLAQLGIGQLLVVAELLPGIPLLRGRDRYGRDRQIVTKAGNFGDEQTLVQLFAHSQ
jgi:uncharacterized protein YgbK (DUF1537 family)